MIQTILQLINEYKEINGISGDVDMDDFINYIKDNINNSNMLKFLFK